MIISSKVSEVLIYICNWYYYVPNKYFNFSEYGIIFSISVWQCLFEFCINLVLTCIFLFTNVEPTLWVIKISMLIYFCQNYVISPSFYLLADSRFRDALTQKGTVKAFWLALKQKYDWLRWTEGSATQFLDRILSTYN